MWYIERTTGRWQRDNRDLDGGNIVVGKVLRDICSALQIDWAALKWRGPSIRLYFYLSLTLITLLLIARNFLKLRSVKHF